MLQSAEFLHRVDYPKRSNATQQSFFSIVSSLGSPVRPGELSLPRDIDAQREAAMRLNPNVAPNLDPQKFVQGQTRHKQLAHLQLEWVFGLLCP